MFRFLLFLLLISKSILFATFLEDANKALQNNKIDEAIVLYKKAAREGDDEANFILGKIYYLPLYKRKDLNLSFHYFKKAADYNHIKAKYNLAIIYSQKKFHKHSFKKAYELFHSLALEGYPNAQFMSAIYLLKGFGTEKDYTLAKKWLEEAYFENKYEKASCGIAFIYANGYGVLQNLGRARKFSYQYKEKFSLCKSVYNEFKLYKKKYLEDKGFKFGYYNDSK